MGCFSLASTLPPSSLNQTDTWIDSLHLTFLGYAFTLGSKYSTQVGVEANANTLIENLVSGSQYISAGLIAANTMPFYVEDMEAYRAWDVIKDVANAGDAAGNRWVCGIYNDRKIYYHQAVEQPVARLRGGKFLDPGGGALQGWTARPGWVMLDDIPRPVDFGVAWEETMRGVWMDEVNFSVSRWLDDGSGLSYRSDIL